MLGSELLRQWTGRFELFATTRKHSADSISKGVTLISGVDADRFDSVIDAFARARPDVVVNCVGVIKQKPEAKDPLISISINSLFPNRLAALCRASGARLIHISTDCVFSGRKGMYTESDVSDAVDLYGKSKALGEVDAPGALTVRTSIIGREPGTAYGLLEWFLSNRGGRIKGFTKAVYSGFTTTALGRILADVIESHPALEGLWNVASDPISKYDLLLMANEAFQTGITIDKDETFSCDRSLDGSRFIKQTGIKPPSWQEMIDEAARVKPNQSEAN